MYSLMFRGLYVYMCILIDVMLFGLIKHLRTIAAIGSVALGSAMAWTSPALPHIADCESDCDFHFTDIDGSWIGSLLNLGALPSCLMSGYLMYRIGCKWSMIALSVPFTLGWALILLPLPLDMSYDANKWIFYVGRFLTGTFNSDLCPSQLLT